MTDTLAGIRMGAVIQGIMGGDSMMLRRFINAAASVDPSAGFDRERREYPFKGYPESGTSGRLDKSLVRDGTVIFGCYGNTIEVEPRADDEVVDSDGCVHVVYYVDRDSVGAVFVLYCTTVRS